MGVLVAHFPRGTRTVGTNLAATTRATPPLFSRTARLGSLLTTVGFRTANFARTTILQATTTGRISAVAWFAGRLGFGLGF